MCVVRGGVFVCFGRNRVEGGKGRGGCRLVVSMCLLHHLCLESG